MTESQSALATAAAEEVVQDQVRRLTEEVLNSMKSAFVGKDEIIDVLGVCLIAGENMFLMGPPGTAKSALVHELAARLHGRSFDYLLTRFTEPNELFGPFDIRRLRDGELVTNKEGMLPEADLVFLDELLNANSAVLNSLLMVLNERVFRRGRETIQLPMLIAIGASNHLPEDETLQALFDRFLLRVPCRNVAQEQLQDVLMAGWSLDAKKRRPQQEHSRISVEDIRALQGLAGEVDLAGVRRPYVELIQRLRHAGAPISDRRAVKLQRLMAASALICGRTAAVPSDLWVLRYTWDSEEQQEILSSLVQDAIQRCGVSEQSHPRVNSNSAPDPEAIARDLERIEARLTEGVRDSDKAYARDQLGVLAGRCEWISSTQSREFLTGRVRKLLEQLRDAL
ncbi:AAA family ATPase [Planctomicrobium piriforme]|uniref:MoxR-like ATPase n=1 Tax=Planctomicrobium piriforme TaxID=1576369 RepID=A0A1I3E218_9PLAN|nr:AAA family ATPase [Planctomicrobium piriforme]SFH92878.1 MoxR-like ATPase [Planctomicrobium piriforme]